MLQVNRFAPETQFIMSGFVPEGGDSMQIFYQTNTAPSLFSDTTFIDTLNTSSNGWNPLSDSTAFNAIVDFLPVRPAGDSSDFSLLAGLIMKDSLDNKDTIYWETPYWFQEGNVDTIAPSTPGSIVLTHDTTGGGINGWKIDGTSVTKTGDMAGFTVRLESGIGSVMTYNIATFADTILIATDIYTGAGAVMAHVYVYDDSGNVDTGGIHDTVSIGWVGLVADDTSGLADIILPITVLYNRSDSARASADSTLKVLVSQCVSRNDSLFIPVPDSMLSSTSDTAYWNVQIDSQGVDPIVNWVKLPAAAGGGACAGASAITVGNFTDTTYTSAVTNFILDFTNDADFIVVTVASNDTATLTALTWNTSEDLLPVDTVAFRQNELGGHIASLTSATQASAKVRGTFKQAVTDATISVIALNNVCTSDFIDVKGADNGSAGPLLVNITTNQNNTMLIDCPVSKLGNPASLTIGSGQTTWATGDMGSDVTKSGYKLATTAGADSSKMGGNDEWALPVVGYKAQ